MNTPIELQNAIRAYAEGNKESFTQIYELSYQYLHTCVIHIVKDEDVALDMLQETYIEISRNILQLQNTNVFLNWAATIANRKCFAYMKKNKDILCDAEAPEGYFENIADDERVIPEEVYQDREKQRLIRGIIDDLSDIQRLCVIGFFYNEQKQEDIARELDIPVNTVKSHINRAKSKIKEAVVELDVKKGTRLYSIAPFMLFLLLEEAKESAIPAMSSMLASVAGVTVAQASVTGVTTATTAAGAVQTASAVAGGTVKAAALTLKAKIAIALASLGGVALIGTGAYFAAPAIGEFFDSSEEYSYDDDDDKRDKHKKDEEDDGEVTEEDSETQKERKEFEPWDTISHRLGGENRCFYYKGQKVTMPTMVGEWEELLGVEFVEKNPATVHEIDGALDKNDTSYVFMINRNSYELKSDIEEELEQFRNSETYGIVFHYSNGSGFDANDAWCSDFSLLEDCNMFLDDIETVNEKLVEKYNIASYHITGLGENHGVLYVVDFENGYYFEWNWDEDIRWLNLKYIPNHYLAYYRYLHDEMSSSQGTTFSEEFSGVEVSFASGDITNDGLDDLIIFHPNLQSKYTVITYDEESGKLYEFKINDDVYIRDDGVACNATSYGKYGEVWEDRYLKISDNSSYPLAEEYLYVYDKHGNRIQLIKFSTRDGNYYLNDKPVTEEVHDEYGVIYKCSKTRAPFGLTDVDEIIESLETRAKLFHYDLMDGIPQETYPIYEAPSGSDAEVEVWKENYVAAIQRVISGEICLNYDDIDYQYSGELYFNLKDINHDSIPELFLCMEKRDNYLCRLCMFSPESTEQLMVLDGLYEAGNVLFQQVRMGYNYWDTIYHYDGKQIQYYYELSDTEDLTESGEIVRHCYYKDENGEREITPDKCNEMMESFDFTSVLWVEAIPFSIENLEKELGISIIRLDADGYEISAK